MLFFHTFTWGNEAWGSSRHGVGAAGWSPELCSCGGDAVGGISTLGWGMDHEVLGPWQVTPWSSLAVRR